MHLLVNNNFYTLYILELVYLWYWDRLVWKALHVMMTTFGIWYIRRDFLAGMAEWGDIYIFWLVLDSGGAFWPGLLCGCGAIMCVHLVFIVHGAGGFAGVLVGIPTGMARATCVVSGCCSFSFGPDCAPLVCFAALVSGVGIPVMTARRRWRGDGAYALWSCSRRCCLVTASMMDQTLCAFGANFLAGTFCREI